MKTNLQGRAFTVTVIWTLLLLYLGSVVHATESSLACPDWPTCNGTMFPEMSGGIFWEHMAGPQRDEGPSLDFQELPGRNRPLAHPVGLWRAHGHLQTARPRFDDASGPRAPLLVPRDSAGLIDQLGCRRHADLQRDR
jgi:hypothetical protein